MVRVAHALGSRGEIKLVRRKGTKAGRGRNGGGKSKPAAFEAKFAAAGCNRTRERTEKNTLAEWYIFMIYIGQEVAANEEERSGEAVSQRAQPGSAAAAGVSI